MKMIKKISMLYGKKSDKLIGTSYKLFCFLSLVAILFTYSCKQSSSGKETQQINVTITVKGDEGLINQMPQVSKVKKNSTWKEIEKAIHTFSAIFGTGRKIDIEEAENDEE